MEYKFIVNTENVNSYGYRIITEGIDTSQYERNPVVLFMHKRAGSYDTTGDEVIGKARLDKEGDKLVAYIIFDTENEFAKKIEGKVKGDYIRMCSMYADVIETSSDAKLVLPGQKYETVTQCKLVEISIVDIGGNDDAIRLSKEGELSTKIKLLKTNTMSELKNIALALGKDANTHEVDLLQSIGQLKLAKETAENSLNDWKGKFVALQKAEATQLVEQAVNLHLIPEDLKDGQISLFESDFDGQKAKLSKLIAERQSENEKNTAQNLLGTAVQLAKGAGAIGANAPSTESFDYLQKHQPIELARIRKNEPQKYNQLAEAYAKGERYTKPTN